MRKPDQWQIVPGTFNAKLYSHIVKLDIYSSGTLGPPLTNWTKRRVLIRGRYGSQQHKIDERISLKHKRRPSGIERVIRKII